MMPANNTLSLLLRAGDTRHEVLLHASGNAAGLWDHCVDASLTVQSDVRYRIELPGLPADASVQIYVNDVPVESMMETLDRYPSGLPRSSDLFFRNCADWAQISVSLRMPGQAPCEYVSAHLPVQLRAGSADTEALERMVQFILKHNSAVLREGDLSARRLASLQADTARQLEGRLFLAARIVDEYTRLYSFFRANSRFEMKQVQEVMPFERLRRLEPSTLRYISAHPEQLQPVNHWTPIRLQHQTLEPVKTLAMRDVPSSDIYENRVVAGFLRLVAHELRAICRGCSGHLTRQTDSNEHRDGYVSLTGALCRVTKRNLRQCGERASELLAACERLSLQYEKTLGVPPDMMTTLPRATEVFFHVDQYARIFRLINQWNALGGYDLSGQEFFVSITGVSGIYESYVLLKLLAYFQDRGWAVSSARPVQTQGMDATAQTWGRVVDLACGDLTLRIYQQPLIAGTAADGQDVCGLYRNNAYTYQGGPGEAYYRPDYVLAASDGESVRFLVLDAKFSSWDTIARYQAGGLLFKYITSLTPVRPQDVLCGLAICCGKGADTGQVHSMYDCSFGGGPPKPDASWIQLSESPDPAGTAAQYAMLDQLFGPLLSFGS